jgi:hypothetical protein
VNHPPTDADIDKEACEFWHVLSCLAWRMPNCRCWLHDVNVMGIERFAVLIQKHYFAGTLAIFRP